MQVVEYDPSRRADVAELMERVWGKRPDEAELEWFYERNPVRPASVLLGEEDGKIVATVAISFVRDVDRRRGGSRSGCRSASRPTPPTRGAGSSRSSRPRTRSASPGWASGCC